MSYVARAYVGAKLLDSVEPTWYRHIIIDRLDMSNPRDCILGQSFGNWNWANDRIGNRGCGQAFQADHGFELLPEHYRGDETESTAWRVLRLAWIEEIMERLESEQSYL